MNNAIELTNEVLERMENVGEFNLTHEEAKEYIKTGKLPFIVELEKDAKELFEATKAVSNTKWKIDGVITDEFKKADAIEFPLRKAFLEKYGIEKLVTFNLYRTWKNIKKHVVDGKCMPTGNKGLNNKGYGVYGK